MMYVTGILLLAFWFIQFSYGKGTTNANVEDLKSVLKTGSGQKMKADLKQELIHMVLQELVIDIQEDIHKGTLDLTSYPAEVSQIKESIKGYLVHKVALEIDVPVRTQSTQYQNQGATDSNNIALSEIQKSSSKQTQRDLLRKNKTHVVKRDAEEGETFRVRNNLSREPLTQQRRAPLLTDVMKTARRFVATVDNLPSLPHVAFTAYLDYDANNLAIDQTIKFNQVLMNDANAYNTHTGVFTAPIDGVYVFALHFVSLTGKTELRIVLDDNHLVGTDADHFDNSTSYGVQPGNLCVIRARTGQGVWVETFYTDNGNVAGNDAYRDSTFSGFLLYTDQ